MDIIFDILLHTGLITAALVTYLIFFRKSATLKGEYRIPGWNYPLKLVCARYYAIRRWKAQLPKGITPETPREDLREGWDVVSVRTTSPDGATVHLEIRKLCGRQPLVEVTVYVKLADGTAFVLPRAPDTVIGAWESIPGGWSAGGLKIQVLEPRERWRVLYNGLLTRVADGFTQHVKLNLTWASASEASCYPQDWSNELAAQALALEPWRDDQWYNMLSKWEEGGWLQWGTAQGRLEAFDAQGAPSHSEYLRTRGARERRWAPHGWAGLRREVTFTAAAADGTALHLRGLSYKNVLTQCISGTVRLPNTKVMSVTGTNLQLTDFCESADEIPNVFTFTVGTKARDLRVVVRVNKDGARAFSGVPYQREAVFRTASVDVDGEPGAGLLELGYAPTTEPSVRLSPPRTLKWMTEAEAGRVGYCLAFEDRAAACPGYVGGKGASLALLASVQKAGGYRVPPGFCLTVHALEYHLELNTHLIKAVRDIEAANEDYNEAVFKEKCNRAVELFASTEIIGEVREEILAQLTELRKKATKENLGPERRFAVRSSAVGEDSETLSAAGQNETILGCVSDSDVLKGVQKCWGSMFAFTSAYYRRQNGQPCLCGGGVVVQALVAPRAAGVMFTRHPRAGDPSRLLITANYGLGESVVSGLVDPDTIVVSRALNDELKIAQIELGAKSTRVTPGEEGVATEEVPEAERKVACVSEAEALRLAQLGVLQEELWGAGRDIEWAISQNDIFLVQARPITSLERWSEEELLHELDSPIMADDEFTTFANCGEVFPKPVSPLSHDLVLQPLIKGMSKTVSADVGPYEDSVIVTHNRCILALYNSVYRRAPPKVDVNIRMVEMAVHGHKVADDAIIGTAVRRRPPRWTDKIEMLAFLVKSIFRSKSYMTDTVKRVKALSINTQTEDPSAILQSISSTRETMGRVAFNHSSTSAASTCSQFIAMTVLLEGANDFSPEQCNEICALLSSGDVLSAEVPLGLARLSHEIEQAGNKADAFRALDPKQAMGWLKANLTQVYYNVLQFLEEHGHRAIMEFDMSTKPWVLVPEELMKILQHMKITKQEVQTTKSDAEVIGALNTPKKSSTRKVLSWVLPLCRRTVRHREVTKAHVILGVHKLRLAALQLGTLLVKRWYLPHRDLVFFFRASELTDYIQTRDPALLRKAVQRHQYYSGWCKLKFAELNTGWVQPLATLAPRVAAGDVRLEATAVCGGDVVARACVVKDLAEIDQLRQGDVLITYATDIGWSPYFPLLSGIVTELGGLISHGAVIAREYGLPCIVGATHATDMFKTGDMVRLTGSKGVIEKVQVEASPAEQES
ncbi:hypothetical protein ABMA27_006958 [Loxostege sticticalis]|uniref:Phosphoenolpyruvate synthase n=1 Tax=Loxostege sticticalis TaxID=481309 RepID=A0ABR3IL16_LOXSC